MCALLPKLAQPPKPYLKEAEAVCAGPTGKAVFSEQKRMKKGNEIMK